MDAAQSYRNPPSLNDSKSYEQWKNEISMWRLVTNLDENKQALALALSLTGKPREVALQIEAAKLNVDDGVDVLLRELDKLFEKDKVDRAYSAYSEFEGFKKTAGMTMSDYIVGFEQNYNKARKHEMVLPDAVLAFKVLDNACLSQSDRQLALTACSSLKFDDMKTVLNRIFSSRPVPAAAAENSESFVKQEPVYVVESKSMSRKGKKFVKKKSYGPDSSKKLNPSYNGATSRCKICDSKMHWARACPHRDIHVNLTENDSDEPENVNIVLFTKSDLTPQDVFVAEAFNSAVIDTACSKTVCGTEWLASFLESLDESKKLKIKRYPSTVSFKFGDGVSVNSYEKVRIPAMIGKTKCFIDSEVVKCKIPLLLSKESLKRANTTLDLAHDKVTMFGEQVSVSVTSSGHYCISILSSQNSGNNRGQSVCTEREVLFVEDDMSKLEKKSVLKKLHRQFGHASFEKLIKLLKNAGNVTKETMSVLKDVCEKCEICFQHKRPKTKPIVSLPLANDFNQVVALDLHEIDSNLYYLHIIDVFSRLSAASIIRNKNPQTIVDRFMQHWVSIYGSPTLGIFTDNGGEFNNEIFRDMACYLNMSVKSTAAYSPWSNGIVERHNATLTETLLKLKDRSMSWETALSWAISAKNCLISIHGFSPYQIVFGRNPNLPSLIVDQPPALEICSSDHVVGKHLTALHKARQAFMAAEASEKVRRALRKQVRPYGGVFEMGDRVYFLRDNKWKGPGVVIGQDSTVVFVRYGGTYVRVHASRLLKKLPTDTEIGSVQNQPSEKTRKHLHVADPVVEYELTDDEDLCCQQNRLVPMNQDSAEQQLQFDNTDHAAESPELPECTAREFSRQDHTTVASERLEQHDESRQDNSSCKPTRTHTPNIRLKPGEIISFSTPDGNYEASVMSRAGKASAKNKNWYNIEFRSPDNVQGSKVSMDLECVDNLQVMQCPEQIVDGSKEESVMINEVDFDDAREAELKSWKELGVYKEVEDTGQKCVSTRWVYTMKENQDGIQKKARLVARGFEEDCVEKTDSPTCDKQSLRVVISVICQKGWKINSMDIKRAFLQGEQLKREVYIKPPKEAKSHGKLWLLKKCVYGLSDASLKWYEKVRRTLISTGGQISAVDPGLFYWMDGNDLIGIFAIHVDDFLWGGTPIFEKTVVEKVRSELQVGSEASASFKYLGMDLMQEEECLVLSQGNYITSLQTAKVDRKRMNNSTLLAEEKTVLRAKLGQLLWIAHQTRPDLSFDVCNLATHLKDPTIQDLKQVNKLIRKVKTDEISLTFKKMKGKAELLVFSDASFGNLPDGYSQGGHIILLVDEDGCFNLLTWNSKKIRRVVRSTLAAETLALGDAIDSAIFIGTLYGELLNDGGIILGASGLTGRYWLGSLWYYENPSFAADVEKCTAGVQLESGITDVVWIGSSRVLLALDTGGVEIWDLEDNFKTFTHVQTVVEHDDITSSISQLEECQKAVSGSYDRSIKVWDLESMLSVHTLKVHTDIVYSVKCHPSESNIFSSCSQDNNVILWDLRNPKPALIVDTSPLQSYPNCLAWQKKSQFVLAIGSECGQTVVKDIRNVVNSPVSYTSHTRNIHRLEFCPTRCNMLASVSDDCTVVVTNIDTNKPEQIYRDTAHKDFVHGLSWTTSGETLYTCGWDSHVRSQTMNSNLNESKSHPEPTVMDVNGDINKHKTELSIPTKDESENKKNNLLICDHEESAKITA